MIVNFIEKEYFIRVNLLYLLHRVKAMINVQILSFFGELASDLCLLRKRRGS